MYAKMMDNIPIRKPILEWERSFTHVQAIYGIEG
jgi:hypothetical protein